MYLLYPVWLLSFQWVDTAVCSDVSLEKTTVVGEDYCGELFSPVVTKQCWPVPEAVQTSGRLSCSDRYVIYCVCVCVVRVSGCLQVYSCVWSLVQLSTCILHFLGFVNCVNIILHNVNTVYLSGLDYWVSGKVRWTCSKRSVNFGIRSVNIRYTFGELTVYFRWLTVTWFRGNHYHTSHNNRGLVEYLWRAWGDFVLGHLLLVIWSELRVHP